MHSPGMLHHAPASPRTNRTRKRPQVPLLLALLFSLSGTAQASAATPAGLRIVSGTSVPSIVLAPYQAALFAKTAGGLFGQPAMLAFCGAVVIDATQLLTAAHCVSNELTGQPVDPASVTAFAGSATLPSVVPTQPVATRIAIEPQYDPQTADYDVAVVTLSTPLYSGSPRADGTTTVAPIPLITPALADRFANPNVTPAEPVLISGWGVTSPLPVGAHDTSGNLPQQLQAALTHLVPDATCASQYASLGNIGVPSITPRMLCAGEAGGGVDACSGDSGGPLVVDVNTPATPPGDFVLAGLIDFGAGCAQAGLPGVYARLATPEITSFVAQQAQAVGQQLVPAPVPIGASPPRQLLGGSGRATIAVSRVRVRSRLARVAVRCATATCSGTLSLRTTTTVGVAHFSIAPGATTKVPVRITPSGQRQLDRHQHRLRTHATLRTTGSGATRHTLTIIG